MGRFLEREGLLERDTEQLELGQLDLVRELADDDPTPDLLGHSITYRIAVGPHRGRKVFRLQTLPTCDLEDSVAGFSLHAGVTVKAMSP